MSATDIFEDELLDLIFMNENIADVGDATGLVKSTADGDCKISLATVDYIDADTVATADEAAYGGYARATIARGTAGGWSVASGTVDNDAATDFVEATSGSETEVCFGIVLLSTGNILAMYGVLLVDLAVSVGITPEFAAGELNITVD